MDACISTALNTLRLISFTFALKWDHIHRWWAQFNRQSGNRNFGKTGSYLALAISYISPGDEITTDLIIFTTSEGNVFGGLHLFIFCSRVRRRNANGLYWIDPETLFLDLAVCILSPRIEFILHSYANPFDIVDQYRTLLS